MISAPGVYSCNLGKLDEYTFKGLLWIYVYVSHIFVNIKELYATVIKVRDLAIKQGLIHNFLQWKCPKHSGI